MKFLQHSGSGVSFCKSAQLAPDINRNIYDDAWRSTRLWLRDRQVFLVPDSVKQYEKRGNGIKIAFDYALPSTKGGCITG